MNTFVPFASFRRTARVLDYYRLGRQRSENLQILEALCGHVLVTTKQRINPLSKKQVWNEWNKDNWYAQPHKSGWVNHPVLNMWRNHESLFREYHIAICNEWLARGYKDTCLGKFLRLWELRYEGADDNNPVWYGDSLFHLSYQSVLIRKAPEFYRPLFPGAPERMEFKWPDLSP